VTSLRWLAWPSPRRQDGALVTYAHAFITVAGKIGETSLCASRFPEGSVLSIVRATVPVERCHFCDQACRDMGAPHPGRFLKPDEYEPVHLFEEWANL
jgi:hypothetical protein